MARSVEPPPEPASTVAAPRANPDLVGHEGAERELRQLDEVDRLPHAILLSGPRGIECRSGGRNGDYTLVFSFANTLTNVGGASIISGTGSVVSNNIDSSDSHNYIVSLTGVTNAQVITVSLTNVSDSAGNFSGAVSVQMGVLIGDTTGNGSVNSSDIAQTQSQSGQPVTSSNFREDVTANGVINSSDISLVQSESGTALP